VGVRGHTPENFDIACNLMWPYATLFGTFCGLKVFHWFYGTKFVRKCPCIAPFLYFQNTVVRWGEDGLGRDRDMDKEVRNYLAGTNLLYYGLNFITLVCFVYRPYRPFKIWWKFCFVLKFRQVITCSPLVIVVIITHCYCLLIVFTLHFMHGAPSVGVIGKVYGDVQTLEGSK
jgi:hypothetical protein